MEDRESFLRQLNRDIARHIRRAEQAQLTPVVRLNMGSDLDWMKVVQGTFPVISGDNHDVRLPELDGSRLSDGMSTCGLPTATILDNLAREKSKESPKEFTRLVEIKAIPATMTRKSQGYSTRRGGQKRPLLPFGSVQMWNYL